MAPLKLFTWNISSGNLSSRAPAGFSTADKCAAIARLVAQEAPDFCSLQELQRPDELQEQLAEAGLYQVASAPSHCGHTVVYVAGSLLDRVSGTLTTGPLAAGQLLPPPGGGRPRVLAAGHLEPFAEGASARLAQLQGLLGAVPPDAELCCVGDCNMRKAENAAGEREGGGGAVGVHVVRALPRWPSVDLACRWQAPGGSAWGGLCLCLCLCLRQLPSCELGQSETLLPLPGCVQWPSWG